MIPLFHADSLLEKLRGNGLKLTPQRRLICRLIAENDTHPTVEELHDRATEEMPGMSLKTVYTTLYELADMEAIRLVNVGSGGSRIESNLSPHSHLVCRRCNDVIDVPVDPKMMAEVTTPAAVLERYDFTVEHQEIIFRGVCGSCALEAAKQGEVVAR